MVAFVFVFAFVNLQQQKANNTKPSNTQKGRPIGCPFCVFGVELEGIEPSSKRGNHMLSTCLSLPSVFECKQDQSHPLTP